jgi:hypothetical protein
MILFEEATAGLTCQDATRWWASHTMMASHVRTQQWSRLRLMMAWLVRTESWLQLDTSSRRKRCQPFLYDSPGTMERKCNSCGKRTKKDDQSLFFRTPNRLVDNGTYFTFHRLFRHLERGEKCVSSCKMEIHAYCDGARRHRWTHLFDVLMQ